MQHPHDRQTRVQPDKVRQLQRAHRHIGAVAHDVVNVLARPSHARLETDDGLVDVRHQDPVGEKAGRVGAAGGRLAHALAEGSGGGDGGGGRLQARDDFDAALDGDGIHEVGCYDAGGGVGVGGRRGLGGGGDARDGDGGCVCGENGMRGTDLGEAGEDGGLEVGDFLDG